MGTMTQERETYRQRVGTTGTGEYVVIDAEIRQQRGERQTVTHGTVSDPLELGISGSAYAAHTSPLRGHDAVAAGQVIDLLLEITKPAPGWTLEEIAELRNIWERWHLNTMRAGCAHQTVVYEDSDYGRRPSLEQTPPCPETGYRYGHAWLTEPLPADVVERVRYLMRDRSDALYRARGYDGAGKAYPRGE